MLRIDKLASRCVTGTRNGEFSDSAIHFANTLAGKHTEHAEMTGRVIENIRDQCEYTPPVAGRACRCAGFGDRITVTEKKIVIFFDVIRCVFFRNLF